MTLVHEKYATEQYDEDGRLCKIDFDVDENYNFGFDIIDEIAKKTPNKPAMIWLSNDKKKEIIFTYNDIMRYSNMTANYFKSLGIKKGDAVLLVLKRHYQFWFSMIALHKIGAIAVPATNQLMKSDFVYRINTASIKMVVITSDGDVYKQCDEAIRETDFVKIKVITGEVDGWNNFDEGIKDQSDIFERPCGEDMPKRDEIMLMYFTSGTTSYPKLVEHAHTYSLGHLVTAKHWHNVDSDGVHFTISDTGWGKAAWGKLYGQWLCETCIMTYDFDRFEPSEILPLFKKYNITTFCAPPTMYRFFIKEDLSQYDFSSLKYATVAGEALNPEVFNKFYESTNIKLMEGFGQTETTLTIGNFVGDEPKLGSMGKPNPQYDIVLVNDQDEEVSTGLVGEIAVRLKEDDIIIGLFKGYHNDEQATNRVCHDGLYHTGDTAWKDENGYFWYEGRTDDLIKTSGYRVAPFEIESVIMQLPYVLECAVTGVPDEVRGQVIKATIVLIASQEASEELKKEVQAYVKTHTAPYKYPRIVDFVKDLPKTISGKIQRAVIRNS